MRILRFGPPKSLYTDDERIRIDTLARFNSERSHGIVHSKDWVELMAREQAWFNENIAGRGASNTGTRSDET